MSIELKHVSKTIGKQRILDDLSFTIPDGALVALLGPSGSGKTTLLRILSGLEVPDANAQTEIRFRGESVLQQSVGARRVGFVFQHYALFRHLTVYENIAFGLRVRPRAERPTEPQIRDKVQRLLSLIQLEGLEQRYPAQLSGGQRQRVALARALAIEPKILLLDEPFGALDAKVRKSLREWLRKLHQELHITSVLVTHDQEEALEVADEIVILNHGRMEQMGSPIEVFQHPSSEFVLDFLGSVNLFRGRVHNGCAELGGVSLHFPEYPHAEPRPAHVYMRPHELLIKRQPNGVPSFPAKVERIHAAGALAKVGVRTSEGTLLQVEMGCEQFDELRLKPGEEVFVFPRQARVFLPDYQI